MTKTAIVTGANRGIGLEVARQLGRQGFRVWLGVRNADSGIEAADRLARDGLDVSFLQMDVCDEMSIRNAFKRFSDRHEHLNVLVNNAGILLDESKNILAITREEMLSTIETNTIGPLLVARTFAEALDGEAVSSMSRVEPVRFVMG